MSGAGAHDPAAHLRGVLTAFDALTAERADTRELPALRALLDRPAALPAQVPASEAGLKYDLYFASDATRTRWGVTINDRYEPDAFGAELERFVAALPADYAWDAVQQVRAALAADGGWGADPDDRGGQRLTFAVGFDAPGAPPRLKLYFQEDAWQRGVGRVAQAGALAEQLGVACPLPGWLDPQAALGVLALELEPGRKLGLKLYLGADSAEGLASGAAGSAPREVELLARILGQACPLRPAYYYLTVRLRDGGPRYAVNKIYNAVQLAEAGSQTALRAAWDDVQRLFAVARRKPALAKLRAQLQAAGVRALPTATALEGKADSADVYFSVFEG